ncbi:cupin domain-containing protein [Roseivirga pacifica]|uniref:cupin domain-containing protein n=1 Tax=Roseivirga pacifica TaxID=1267423 RepID=UPI003BB1D797
MKKPLFYSTLTLTLMTLSAFVGWKGHEKFTDIESIIVSRAQANISHDNWGDIVIYTPEDGTNTFGTKNTLTAVAEIKPGEQIHPPHQHTAEEFMYILEGEGTWSLKGEESPAKAGDMMYAKPWDWHGLTNTGDKTLKFFVVKWDNKGVKAPKKP